MGGLFSSAKMPKVEQTAAPILTNPIEAETSAADASDLERKRRKAAAGRSDTILTSGMGLTSSATTGLKRTLGG